MQELEAPRIAVEIGSPMLRFWGTRPAGVRASVVVTVLGLVAVVAYLQMGSPSQSASRAQAEVAEEGASLTVAGGTWTTDWATDSSGSRLSRQISLYRPSMTLSDYRVEFSGVIEQKSMGWVFRVKDLRNYYGMKLHRIGDGSGRFSLARYSVLDGEDKGWTEIPLALEARPDTIFRVRLDARGPRFSTYIQGQAVDVWSDEQLRAGGFGFSNDRDGRALIRSVRMSYLR